MKFSRGRSAQVTSFQLALIKLKAEAQPKIVQYFQEVVSGLVIFQNVVISSGNAVNLTSCSSQRLIPLISSLPLTYIASVSRAMCGSGKYPYPHHGGNWKFQRGGGVKSPGKFSGEGG